MILVVAELVIVDICSGEESQVQLAGQAKLVHISNFIKYLPNISSCSRAVRTFSSTIFLAEAGQVVLAGGRPGQLMFKLGW